jgi:hypothetical protein
LRATEDLAVKSRPASIRASTSVLEAELKQVLEGDGEDGRIVRLLAFPGGGVKVDQ